MTDRAVAMENVFFLQPALEWDERCARIAAAGYAGVYVVPYPLTDDDLPRLRSLGKVPRRHGLRVCAVYANLDLAQPSASPEARGLRRLFEEVEGTPRIELSIKCSDRTRWPDSVEAAAAGALTPLLEIADRRGIAVALYPHSFYPLERLAQVRGVLARLAHPTLSFVFPLSHSFNIQPPPQVLADLSSCVREVASMNVCGCRRTGVIPSKCQHLPLDEGDVSFPSVASVLRAAHYSREIIVQGHGWPGDPDNYLRRSLAVLRAHASL